jgi:hypothetical protein
LDLLAASVNIENIVIDANCAVHLKEKLMFSLSSDDGGLANAGIPDEDNFVRHREVYFGGSEFERK